MRSTFALAALAGVALSAPHYGARPQGDVVWVVETIVETVTVVDDGTAPTYAAQSPAYVAPAVTTVVYNAQPAYTPPAYTPAPYQPTPKPAPKPTPSAAPAPPSSDTGYMAIVNQYRGMMGKPAFTQDSTLEGNNLKCLQASPGQMVHSLAGGSMGQVLAPGGPDDFKHVFVGGWLCEMPQLVTDGECSTQSDGWIYDGVGHAEILSSDGYTKIGCANYDGIWGCDVA